MKTLLVCTDGSAYAPSLYDHTLWAARRLDAAIRLVHFVKPFAPPPIGGESASLMGTEAHLQFDADMLKFETERVRLSEQRGQTLLAAARARFERDGIPPARIQTELLKTPLTETVAQLSAGHELVLVGKRGDEHADQPHLGDHLERILRTSAHPVLVVPRAHQPIERFLLAYDGGPAADKAVAHLVETPLLRGLPCHLVSVGNPEDVNETALFAARDRLAAAGYTVRAEILPGFPNEVIAETVRRERATLIVMGAYGHGRIRRFFLGSTTADMIRSCSVPLLMFR